MKKILLATLVMITGCTEVSKIPKISDVSNIIVNDKKYTAIQYIREFCQFPEAEKDTNCYTASVQANKDMSKFRNVKMAD